MHVLLNLENNSLIRNIFTSPNFTKKEKRQTLSKILTRLDFSDIHIRFLHLLIAKNRLSYFIKISDAFQKEVNIRLNLIDVTITSPFPLKKKTQHEVLQMFKELTKKDVNLYLNIDKNLIGGIKAEFTGYIFDDTISEKLNLLKIYIA